MANEASEEAQEGKGTAKVKGHQAKARVGQLQAFPTVPYFPAVPCCAPGRKVISDGCTDTAQTRSGYNQENWFEAPGRVGEECS